MQSFGLVGCAAALLLPFGVPGVAGVVGVVRGVPAQVVGKRKDNTQAGAAPLWPAPTRVERRRLDAYEFEQFAKLVASDGSAGDFFGRSVAIDGDRVVVGATGHDTNGDSGRGAAYVYDVSSSDTLTEVAKLVASDGAADDYFGRSVAVDGDRVVVGAWEHDTDGDSNRGAAYVYDISSSGTLAEVTKLVASDGAAGDYFGRGVAVDGDRVVVGAWYHDTDDDYRRGAAYVYDVSLSGTLTEVGKLVASDGVADDRFGVSVAIHGDRVVVGAFHDTDGDSDRGAAYVYDVSSSGALLTEVAKLVASDGAAGDEFGLAVAVDGDRVVVSAYLHDTDGDYRRGAAYVYDVSLSGTLTEVAKLVASDGAAEDRFGIWAAIKGDRVVVGAFYHDTNGDSDRGAAYVYDASSSGTLTEVAKLVASDGVADDEFGLSVAVDGDRVVVCAGQRKSNSDNIGAAYVFVELVPTSAPTFIPTYKPTRAPTTSHPTTSTPTTSSPTLDAGLGCPVLSLLASAQCPDELDLPACDDMSLAAGDLCEGDGECATSTNANNCGSSDVYLVIGWQPTTSPTTVHPTLSHLADCPVLSLVPPDECPEDLDLPTCDNAALIAGSFCEGGDDDCGTSNNADNCGSGYDVYRVVVASTPSPTPRATPSLAPQPTTRATPSPTPGPTFKPTLSPMVPTSTVSHPTLEPTTSKKSGGSSSGPNVAVIAGAAVGVVLLVVAILVYCCCSKMRPAKEPSHDLETPASQSATAAAAASKPVKLHGSSLSTLGPKAKPLSSRQRSNHSNHSAARANARAMLHVVLSAGEEIPGLGAVCAAAQAVLDVCDKVAARATDVEAASDRVCNTIKILQIMADNAASFAEDAASVLVDHGMAQLAKLLEEFEVTLQAFNKQGWLSRQWHAIANGKKLTELDRQIKACLEHLTLAYRLANDRSVKELLKEQKYELETTMLAAIKAKAEADNVSPTDAADALADDENALDAIAKTETVAVVEIQAERARIRQYKLGLLESHEIKLSSIEPEPFAAGGQGQVHRGTFQGNVVAVKVVALHGANNEYRAKLMGELSTELAIMVKLQSPRIVQVFGVVTTDKDHIGMVMEYMAGGALRKRLDDLDASPTIDEEKRLVWCEQIARGMDYLYEKGVQHRDLKANNVLLGSDDACKIADFGLAKCNELRTHMTSKTARHGPRGTSGFMAPELLESNTFTEKADVYSYGMTCYEIATRDRPWSGLQEGQIYGKVVHEKVRPNLPTTVPALLIELVKTCWCQDPDARPTFAEVVARFFVNDDTQSMASLGSIFKRSPTLSVHGSTDGCSRRSTLTSSSFSSAFQVGDNVRLVDLTTKPELNGLSGIVVASADERGRVQVKVVDKKGAEVQVGSFKTSNLKKP